MKKFLKLQNSTILFAGAFLCLGLGAVSAQTEIPDPEKLIENAHLIQKASLELGDQGLIHVMPVSFAKVDGTLRLMLEVLDRAEPSEVIQSAQSLSKTEWMNAAPMLEVKTEKDHLRLAVRRAFSAPLTPVSDDAKDEKDEKEDTE